MQNEDHWTNPHWRKSKADGPLYPTPMPDLPCETTHKSNGGSTDYYTVPEGTRDLDDLIDGVGMSFRMANIFKACFRFGRKDGTSKLYDLNKIIFFAERERDKLLGIGAQVATHRPPAKSE